MVALGLRCCAQAFSSCGERINLTLDCSVWASHWDGFSCFGARALECAGFSILWHMGLAVPWHVAAFMWDLPGPRSETCGPCICRQILPVDHQGSEHYKFKAKERFLKAAREKQCVMYKETPIRLWADFSNRNFSGQKGVAWYIQITEGKKIPV